MGLGPRGGLGVARLLPLERARPWRAFHAQRKQRMGTTPRRTLVYGTVEYYRDRIAGSQEELALGRYRRGRSGGQPHQPKRIQTLRKWIKDDRRRLIEAFAKRCAAAGNTRPLRRLNWIRYVRTLRNTAERLVQYAQAQQRDLERVEESLRIGARQGRDTAKPYAASTLKSLAAHQRRQRKSLEKTLAQIAALPSKAPIPYREWFRLAARSTPACAETNLERRHRC
jgi:hypothetical protein